MTLKDFHVDVVGQYECTVRAHTKEEAEEEVRASTETGFFNIAQVTATEV